MSYIIKTSMPAHCIETSVRETCKSFVDKNDDEQIIRYCKFHLSCE